MNTTAQKGIAQPLVMILVLIGLGLGLYLINQQTHLFSRANYEAPKTTTETTSVISREATANQGPQPKVVRVNRLNSKEISIDGRNFTSTNAPGEHFFAVYVSPGNDKEYSAVTTKLKSNLTPSDKSAQGLIAADPESIIVDVDSIDGALARDTQGYTGAIDPEILSFQYIRVCRIYPSYNCSNYTTIPDLRPGTAGVDGR